MVLLFYLFLFGPNVHNYTNRHAKLILFWSNRITIVNFCTKLAYFISTYEVFAESWYVLNDLKRQSSELICERFFIDFTRISFFNAFKTIGTHLNCLQLNCSDNANNLCASTIVLYLT